MLPFILGAPFNLTLLIVTNIIIVTVLLYFAAVAPISITLSEDRLTLNKVIGKRHILYADINFIEVHEYNKRDKKISGSSGFCGYIGYFYNNEIGRYWINAGNLKQTFIVKKKNGKQYVFSCEDYEALVSEVKSYLS